MKKSPLIQWEILETICGNDQSAMQELLFLIIDQTSLMLTELENYCKLQVKKEAFTCLHNIKGPLGSSGLVKLYKLCIKAEKAIEENHWATLNTLIKEIAFTLERTKLAGKSYFTLK